LSAPVFAKQLCNKKLQLATETYSAESWPSNKTPITKFCRQSKTMVVYAEKTGPGKTDTKEYRKTLVCTFYSLLAKCFCPKLNLPGIRSTSIKNRAL
jgi:hypothetical protein